MSKAERNKTIDTPISEGRKYLDRCITISEPQKTLGNALDKTVLGDMLEVCRLQAWSSFHLERGYKKGTAEQRVGVAHQIIQQFPFVSLYRKLLFTSAKAASMYPASSRITQPRSQPRRPRCIRMRTDCQRSPR